MPGQAWVKLPLREEVEVLAPCFHGVDQQLAAAVELQDDDLQQTTRRVEPEAELSCRTVLVQVTDEDRALGSVDGVMGIDPVPAGGGVDPHATYARIAALITSDRLTWSRSARSPSSASNVSSRRTGTT